MKISILFFKNESSEAYVTVRFTSRLGLQKLHKYINVTRNGIVLFVCPSFSIFISIATQKILIKPDIGVYTEIF